MAENAYKTAGEALYEYLNDRIIPPDVWMRMQEKHLTATARPEGIRTFFQEAVAINVANRLILHGKYINDNILDATAAGFLSYLDRPVDLCGLRQVRGDGALSRMVRDSVIASMDPISPGLRKRLTSWAQRAHTNCYMCGVSLSFSISEVAPHTGFTLDHLWPNSLGGDSVEENLLPACLSCNSHKKRNYPSWAGCNVQMMMIGRNPSDTELESMEGNFKFALHNRAVRMLARQKNLSLKEAYLRVGPWNDSPAAVEPEDVCDFFNLSNQNIVRFSV